MISEQEFWIWFDENKAKYFFLNQIDDQDERERLLNEFSNHLHQYSDKLFFVIGGHADEVQDLIISAEGNVDYFSKVEQLVASAPKLKDWNIVAFKPPVDSGFVIEYNGIKIDPNDTWFLPLENKKRPDQLGLRICPSNYSLSKKGDYLNAAYLALDSILGEKLNALTIQHVEVAELPSNPEEKGLINLKELPRYITWKKTH